MIHNSKNDAAAARAGLCTMRIIVVVAVVVVVVVLDKTRT
jgi:t-SNARE complex subunit (syntaxin)